MLNHRQCIRNIGDFFIEIVGVEAKSAQRRNVDHPRKRWDDGIVNLAGKAWTEEAADMTHWNALEAGYIDKQI